MSLPQTIRTGLPRRLADQHFGITEARHVRIATEGALIGSLIHHGFSEELVILSDDAARFDVLRHALCSIHTERLLQRLLPLNNTHAKAIQWVRTQIWDLYAYLKAYRCAPRDNAKTDIRHHFEELCHTRPPWIFSGNFLSDRSGDMTPTLRSALPRRSARKPPISRSAAAEAEPQRLAMRSSVWQRC